MIGCTEPNQYVAPPPPEVTVAQPLQMEVIDYLEETGTAEAVQRAEVRARVQGILEEINFEPNAMVNEGDILYVIEKVQYEAIVKAAEAELEARKVDKNKADIEYKRQQNLLKENATSDRAVVAAEAEYNGAVAAVDVATAQLRQAQIDLEYTDVRAPISGQVDKTLVKLGNLVGDAEATHLTTVTNYDSVYASFPITERTLLKIIDEAPRDEPREDNKEEVKFYLRRESDRKFPFEGHLDHYDQAVDPDTGTYMIRGIFPNPVRGGEDPSQRPTRQIIPGMFVRVRVPIGVKENALLVPEEAIGADQSGKYVLVVNSENVVERRNVILGTRYEGLIVVVEGLEDNEWVIVKGLQRARPDDQASPKKTELTAPPGDLEAGGSRKKTPAEDSPGEDAPAEDAEGDPAAAKAPSAAAADDAANR
ncbi:MAG: efflux RND transporter periplasmic adaptor subunit [Planctomycetota bacterium]|jgi:RND family efflux transporter MFP subunit